jgi:hypothetical protein
MFMMNSCGDLGSFKRVRVVIGAHDVLENHTGSISEEPDETVATSTTVGAILSALKNMYLSRNGRLADSFVPTKSLS